MLTAPLAGINYGMVDGVNPVNESPVGGAQFFIPNPLTHALATTYAIYFQVDGVDGMGTLVFQSVQVSQPTRGVVHAVLFGPGTPPSRGFMAIFPDLGTDPVNF